MTRKLPFVLACIMYLTACDRAKLQSAGVTLPINDRNGDRQAKVSRTASEMEADAAMAAADAVAAANEANAPALEAERAARRRFTKSEFESYVYEKTKAQIRSEFGPPLSVDDAADSWFYVDLPVYDAEAGTQASPVIKFEGVIGPSDRAVQVTY